ncbi:hypothetical protein V6N13_110709 [Hibiscus sabdariffa]
MEELTQAKHSARFQLSRQEELTSSNNYVMDIGTYLRNHNGLYAYYYSRKLDTETDSSRTCSKCFYFYIFFSYAAISILATTNDVQRLQ